MKTLFEAPNSHEPNQAWCVYSHFDADSDVQDYVIEALKRIKASGLKIIIMSTSPNIVEAKLETMRSYATIIILRENIGYDFGSYKLGIEYLFNNKMKPSQILLTNDSVYGPMINLNPILKKSKKFDMYGMTDSIEINYHLQSYFIIYNERILKDKNFIGFWKSVKLLKHDTKAFKQKIIIEYEVGGSQFFMGLGYKLGAEFPFKKIVTTAWNDFLKDIKQSETIVSYPFTPLTIGYNNTHFYWDRMMNIGFPYIKRELLTTNPMFRNIHNWPQIIKDKFKYDPKLILDSLIKHFKSEDFIYQHNDTKIIAQSLDHNGKAKLKINPAYTDMCKKLNLEKSKTYYFDEKHYLENNPDVKILIDKQIFKDGIRHFKKQGHKENRFFKLNPTNLN